ncbi:MAG: tetratricopeptide repeat protein [Bariatricus sp.]
MAERSEYAVFRFLEQNGYCHMISDYVKGISVMQYVKEEYPVSRECLWRWMAEIAQRLEQYYKWENGKAYGFVNPYAVIIGEDSEIMLLDVTDPGNEDQIRRMQKKKVRMLFVKEEHILTQNAEPEDDCYGLGKTYQFMLEKCRLTEPCTRRETRLIRKVIEKCLSGKKDGIRMMVEIQGDFRSIVPYVSAGKREKTTHRKKNRSGMKRKICVCAAFAILVAAGVILGRIPQKMVYSGSASGEKAKEDRPPEDNVTADEEDTKEEGRVYLELGVMYCVEMENFEEGSKCLEKASEQQPLARIYMTIFEYIQKGGSENFVKNELADTLETGRELLKEQDVRAWIRGKEYWYKIPFMMTYGMLGTQEAWAEAMRLGEEMKQEVLWNETNRDQEKTLRKYLAKAYETEGENEKAAAEYERLKELEDSREGLEEIYLCLEKIYEAEGKLEQSWAICRESIERIPDSEKIWVAYLEKHLKDAGIERQVCAQLVKKAVDTLPNLAVNTEFLKLQKQYEITIKGEEVWVGK